jgi:hypothetical protein
MEVVTGRWTKWQYGELHDLLFLLNFIGGDRIEEGGDGYSMWHVWGRREMHMKL